ncbi:MAG: response regulator [Desulfomonile sp.]|nr:response regulator [Desulfomonile sp.]
METKTVLIVDDDANLCDSLDDIFTDEGYTVVVAQSCAQALNLAQQSAFEVAILDLRLPDGPGIELIERLRTINPDCMCVLMTAFADLQSAIEAVDKGAAHYLVKPVRPEDLIQLVDRLFETIHLRVEKRLIQRALEEEQLKAEKLEAVGLLAGGIAHDFNNLLTAILGNVSLAKLQLEPGHAVHERLGEAERAIQRAKDLTQQLLVFASGGAPVKTDSAISDLIKDSTRFVLRGSKSRWALDVPDDLWIAHVDQGQIAQVLYNLVINADQAMPEGGTITVKAENIEVRPGAGPQVREGRYIKITVRDEGTGVEPKILRRIFDPYFTTKERGSGLGLTTSWSIVKGHGGTITVESTPGKGSSFSVYLPAMGEAPPTEARSTARPLKGKGRVMVMDDEECIRNLLTNQLEALGYEAVHAAEGRQAVELYKKALHDGVHFDAVIMDLIIPGGLGGKEAVAALRKLDPSVKAIVSSGYSNDPVMANYRSHGFVDVITKPYGIEEVSAVLHRVINGK